MWHKDKAGIILSSGLWSRRGGRHEGGGVADTREEGWQTQGEWVADMREEWMADMRGVEDKKK